MDYRTDVLFADAEVCTQPSGYAAADDAPNPFARLVHATVDDQTTYCVWFDADAVVQPQAHLRAFADASPSTRRADVRHDGPATHSTDAVAVQVHYAFAVSAEAD